MHRTLRISLVGLGSLLAAQAAFAQPSAPAAAPRESSAVVAPSANPAPAVTQQLVILPLAPYKNQVRFAWLSRDVQNDLQGWVDNIPGLRATLPADVGQKPVGEDLAAAEVGRGLGASLVLYGTFQLMDPDVRIVVKLADTSTGQVLGVSRVTGPIREPSRVNEALGQLVRQMVRRELGLAAEETKVAEAAGTTRQLSPEEGAAPPPTPPAAANAGNGPEAAPNAPSAERTPAYAGGTAGSSPNTAPISAPFTTYGTVGDYPNAYNPITGQVYPGIAYIPSSSYLYPYYFSNPSYIAAPFGDWGWNYGYGSFFGSSVFLLDRSVYTLPVYRYHSGFGVNFRGRWDHGSFNGHIGSGHVAGPGVTVRPRPSNFVPQESSVVVTGPGRTVRPGSGYVGSGGGSGSAFRSRQSDGSFTSSNPYTYPVAGPGTLAVPGTRNTTFQTGPLIVRQTTPNNGTFSGMANTNMMQGQVNNNMMQGQVNNNMMGGMFNSNVSAGPGRR